MSNQPERHFMELLMRALGDDERPDARANRARVRRGAGDASAFAGVSSVVEPLIGRVESQIPPAKQELFTNLAYIIAPLYALHPQHDPQGTIGHHMRQLGGDGTIPSAVERRFTTLLSTGNQELPEVLRQTVMLLKSRGIGVNWPQLLADLFYGAQSEVQRSQVRRKWARDFWRERPSDQESAEGTDQTNIPNEVNTTL